MAILYYAQNHYESMTTPNDIRRYISLPSETNNIEFKAATKSFDDDKLYKYCVAIANCGGGCLILGVTDKKPRLICGTEWPSDIINKQSQIFNKIGFKVDIQEVSVDGKRVVVFEIPSRPKGHPYELDGAYYTRVGSELRPMRADELSSIFNETKDTWEKIIIKEHCSESDVLNLLDVKSFYAMRGLRVPIDTCDILLDLKHEAIVCQNGKEWDITNMGAILFAKNLKEFPDISHKAVRFIIYNGSSRLETINETVGVKGYASGFEGLINYIKSRIPTNEIIKDALRSDVPIFPIKSIREIVANAMIHQDFNASGLSLKIELFSNRIEITNPGIPQIDLRRFVDECNSRNENLAGLMRQLGVCEERGSGFDKVIFESEFYQLPPPKITTNEFSTTVTLYAPIPFAKMTKDDRIRACYLHCCLRYVAGEKTNNLSLRNRFKLNSRQVAVVSVIIKDSIDAGYIKVNPENKDSTKHRTYSPFWA